MKRKVLSALLASAFVGVATTASAGVIQASYKNYAAEIFGADVSLIAPTVGYSLALPLTGTVGNPNSFTVSYTLDSGTWDPADLPGATLISAADPTKFLDGANGVVDTVPVTGLSRITFQFLLNNGTVFPNGSTINLGSNAVALSVNNPAAAGYAAGVNGDGAIKSVFTKLQTPALPANYCAPTPSSIGITIALTNAAGSPFDSNQPGAQNTTPILQSNAATSTTVQSSAAFGASPASETSQVNVLIGSLGKLFTNPVDVTNSTLMIDIGSITFGPNPLLNGGTLYDTNGLAIYTVGNANWGAAVGADGGVSENGLTFTVTGNFVAGGILNVTSDSAGLVPLAAVTSSLNVANTIATVTVPAASMNNVGLPAVGGVLAGKRTAFVTYTVPGTTVIPTSQFAISSGTLARVAGSNELATPVCPGPIYNLTSNGVKVDVRNYVPNVARAASGWYSVIRVINTDDIQNASPIAQALLANGTLGASIDMTTISSVDGKTGAFKPREVRYFTSTTIDTALNAVATVAAPSYGAADVGGNARLRITAPISSIRVQNYVFNPANGNFIESSAAQSDEGPSAAQLNGQNNK